MGAKMHNASLLCISGKYGAAFYRADRRPSGVRTVQVGDRSRRVVHDHKAYGAVRHRAVERGVVEEAFPAVDHDVLLGKHALANEKALQVAAVGDEDLLVRL